MFLFLGENQYFYKKIIQIFVIGQIKFLKFIVFIYLVLNLMLHYSTYAYSVVFTYKTFQTILKFLFFLPQKLTFLYSGIFWEKHVLLFHRYQGFGII